MHADTAAADQVAAVRHMYSKPRPLASVKSAPCFSRRLDLHGAAVMNAVRPYNSPSLRCCRRTMGGIPVERLPAVRMFGKLLAQLRGPDQPYLFLAYCPHRVRAALHMDCTLWRCNTFWD